MSRPVVATRRKGGPSAETALPRTERRVKTVASPSTHQIQYGLSASASIRLWSASWRAYQATLPTIVRPRVADPAVSYETDDRALLAETHSATLPLISAWLRVSARYRIPHPKATRQTFRQLPHTAHPAPRHCNGKNFSARLVVALPCPRRIRAALRRTRHQARPEVYRRLTHGLTPEQRRRLDALTRRREETSQNLLTWLRQMPEAAKPRDMLGLIERLEHVRAIGIEPGRGHLVHQARFALLAREAGRTTVQHVAGYERQRRHATLVAISLDLAASLSDQAVDLFAAQSALCFARPRVS